MVTLIVVYETRQNETELANLVALVMKIRFDELSKTQRKIGSACKRVGFFGVLKVVGLA